MAADFSWVPPVAVLAAGAVVGALVVVWRSRSKRVGQGPGVTDTRKADLQREYDAVIRHLSEGVPDEEKSGLELQAAKILMELEKAPAASSTPSADSHAIPVARPAPVAKPTSAVMGFIYGAATMGVLGGLVYLALEGASPRSEGGVVTGGAPGSAMSQGSAPPAQTSEEVDKAIATMEDGVRAAPKDIAKRIELTRAYLQKRDLMKVFDQTKAVLEIEPGHPHALTYQALVRVAMGQSDMAENMLLEAIKKDPQIEDAYIHLAIARIQRGNRQGAEEAIQEAQRLFPQDKVELGQMFAQLTSAAEARAANPPADHPETGSAEAPAATGDASPSLVVVVDLPKGVTVPESALLFVIVREAGFESGPPVAVKRVPAANFPITVTLTDKDSMAGESLPGLVRIDARVDRDGNPLTKDPRDPVANEDNVRPGGGQTLLVLAAPKS